MKRKTRRVSPCAAKLYEVFTLFSAAFGPGGLIAHVQQHLDLSVRCAAVQRGGQPALLVHVVGRQDARRTAQGGDQNRVTLEVHHVQQPLPRQPQLFPRHVQNEREPLAVARVPEHRVVRRIGPRMIRLRAVGVKMYRSSSALVMVGASFPDTPRRLLLPCFSRVIPP